MLVGKTLTKLDPPNVTSLATAWGINNNGVITIFGANSAGLTCRYTTADKGKTYKPFHAPGEGTTGDGYPPPNNKGDIVATYFDTAGNTSRGSASRGKYYSFDDPNGSAAHAVTV